MTIEKTFSYSSVTKKENGYFSRIGTTSKIKPKGTNTRQTETMGQVLNRGRGRIPIERIQYNDTVHIDLVKVKKDLRRHLQNMKILK